MYKKIKKISMTKTATSNDVLNYYSNNWERIANCYDLDDRGLPVDPAWYRRRLYNQFLENINLNQF